MLRRLPSFILVALVVAWCGCASTSVRRPDEEVVRLTLYQENKGPLATLQLLLPGTISTNWSTGQWRGELSSAYARPQERHLLASDLLKAPSWRPLKCQIDTRDPKFIEIELQPDQPMDGIQLWIPRRARSSLESNWFHENDRGESEGGTVKVLQR